MELNKTPLVSICIPTYNGSNFIEETLNSALNQTYNNIEIIITDDKSSDHTISLCQSLAKKDSRIKIFENKENLGLVGNWCECVEKASSQWIKFLFQDDLLEPTCVEKMIESALKFNVNFVICNRQYIFEKGLDKKIELFYSEKLPKTDAIFNEYKVYTPIETSQKIAPYIFNNCIGEPPTFLFNKTHYSKNDYPDNYFQLIDYIFILNKILVHNFVFVNEKLVKFRVHNASESMRNSEINVENKKAFHKFLYIHYYEKIQICNEVLNNPIFKDIKKHLPTIDVLNIRKWYILKSYKKHGFKNVFPFYKASKLNSLILDDDTSKYNYVSYRHFKIMFKKTRKKYNV